MHLLEAAGGRFLLDAGLFQGHRAADPWLNARLPFDPRRLDGIVLTHAHIDHAGRLPLLVRHGFHGPIHATPATRDLCAVMLPDAAHIQEKDHEYLVRRGKAGPESEPLYNLADAVAVQELMVGVPYRRITHLRKHLAARVRRGRPHPRLARRSTCASPRAATTGSSFRATSAARACRSSATPSRRRARSIP